MANNFDVYCNLDYFKTKLACVQYIWYNYSRIIVSAVLNHETMNAWCNSRAVKGARSYFSKFISPFHMKNHYSKDVNFKLLKRSNRLDLRSNFVYCSCLYLTV